MNTIQRFDEYRRTHPEWIHQSCSQVAEAMGTTAKNLQANIRNHKGTTFCKLRAAAGGKPRTDVWAAFQRYAQNNAAWKLQTIAAIAKEIGTDQPTLSRAIKRHTGKTVAEYRGEKPRAKVNVWRRFQRYMRKNPEWWQMSLKELGAEMGVEPNSLGNAIRQNIRMSFNDLRKSKGWVPKAQRVTPTELKQFNKQVAEARSQEPRRARRVVPIESRMQEHTYKHPRKSISHKNAIVRGKRLAMGGKTKRQLAAMHAAGQISDAEWKGVEMVYNGEY